jgi:hypothetical protein
MRKNILNLALLVTLVMPLVSCTLIHAREQDYDYITLGFKYDFNDETKKASLVSDYTITNGEIKLPEPEYKLIAGDVIKVRYDGKIINNSTIGNYSYDFNNASIYSIEYRYATIESGQLSETYRPENVLETYTYQFATKDIILNEEGDYIPFTEYTGEKYYLSFESHDYNNDIRYCNGVFIYIDYVLGIYAYNPRQ